LTTILFYIIAALILTAAIAMVFSKNLIHSVLYMVAAFIGIAFIYIMLEADYLAVVQILVYVGAISVLFVFGVMLTKKDSMDKSNIFNRYKLFGGFISLALLILIGRMILISHFNMTAAAMPSSTISAISVLMLNDFAIPFEVSGILLLVAMIGAIIIGKGVRIQK
jgi:NADH-quinone oxidoreductase subunit J